MREFNDTSSERDVIEKLTKSLEKIKGESKAILAGLGDGISIQDRDFKIIYQNEVVQKIMGNQIGKYCYNAYEKRDQVCEKCPIETALKTGQINTSLRVGINKYGKSGYYENTASPIRNKKGEIIAAVEIIRDVSDRVRLEDDVKDRTTELAQANMKLRKLGDELEQKVKQRTAELEKSNNYLDSIIKSMIDSLIVINPDTTIKTVNQAALDLLGYKEDELIGKPVAIIFEEEFSKGSELEDLIKKGFVSNVEKNCLAKDGRSIPLLFSGSLMREPDGQILGLVCVARDISDRKRGENELKEYSERLEERTRELEDAQDELIRKEKLATIGLLASSVGHDLRNPLGVISNSTYYLNMKLKDADEKVRKHLDILQREVRGANKIITDLLEFSRTREPSLAKGDANSILKDVLAEITLPENIALETQLDENLPRIQLDADQIGRVCQNIIYNAIQAMAEGGSLVLKTRIRADFIEIIFQDSGVGIPQENLEKIFEPLFTTQARGIGP